MILEGPRRDIHRSCSTSSGLLLYIFWAPALHLLGSCSTSSTAPAPLNTWVPMKKSRKIEEEVKGEQGLAALAFGKIEEVYNI